MRRLGLILLILTLVGCASKPLETPQPVMSAIAFIDTATFDRDLSKLMVNSQSTIELNFYSPITPNQIPERLQKWLSAVEKNGGEISVQHPPGELAPKSPAMIISLLGSAWTGIKTVSKMLDDRMYSAAKGRDAVLVLERNPVSKMVTVARVEFKSR